MVIQCDGKNDKVHGYATDILELQDMEANPREIELICVIRGNTNINVGKFVLIENECKSENIPIQVLT